MREIKFRAWDKVNKMMLAPVSDLIWNAGGGLEFVQALQDGALRSVREFDLMQFTGLRDTNGSEIYEGDLLACSRRWRKRWSEETTEKYLVVVIFEDGAFKVHHQKTELKNNISVILDHQPEIIGNTYELKNPTRRNARL